MIITSNGRMRHTGFSLVEVAIAVSIAAFGILAVVGLLPQGIEMARRTGELTAQRGIVEQISRDLEQARWTDISAMPAGTPGGSASQTRYYDDQGTVLSSPGPTMSYVAALYVRPVETGILPGSGAVVTPEQYIRRVVIRIATTTNPNFDFNAPLARFNTFQTCIARSR